MTTLTSIINSAFREGGIVAVGDTPDTNEAAEALTILCNLISSFYQNEVGELLIPYNLGDNGITYKTDSDHILTDMIPINSIVSCNLTSAKTVYLDPRPKDGSLFSVYDASGNFATNPLTINGNGRKISGANTLLLNTNNANVFYIHGAGTGWNPITGLSSGSDIFPFVSKFEDLFIIMLARRLNPRYGATEDAATTSVFNRLYKQFKNQYRQSAEVGSELGLYSLPSNRFKTNSNFSKGT